MKLHICTYFDINFWARGMALYRSIAKYHADFVFYVLTFDDATYNQLVGLGHDNIVPIAYGAYNEFFNTSIDKYNDRKQYYFSATPNLCLYLLDRYPHIDILLYLDADVYLFNSLDVIYDEFGEHSIGICPHRLHPLVRYFSQNHGIYNVGVNLFRNSEEGRKCLQEWRNSCESWYQGKPGYHLNYFSDQIFLDAWPQQYSQVKIIENVGVDVAPWNVTNYKFTMVNGQYHVNGTPLVVYHFSALKKTDANVWNANTAIYLGSVRGVLQKMYREYIAQIETFNQAQVHQIQLSKALSKRVFYFFSSLVLNEQIKM